MLDRFYRHHQAGADSRMPACETAGMCPARVRPVGGVAGCLVMVLVSVVLSVLLTVGLNLLLR